MVEVGFKKDDQPVSDGAAKPLDMPPAPDGQPLEVYIDPKGKPDGVTEHPAEVD